MNPFHLISEYFWLLCLAVCAFNYLAARRRLQTSTPHGSSEDAARYLRWFALASSLPWVVMGFGQATGFTPTVWYYFRPQDHNPFVVAWLACIFLLAVIYAVWVFWMGGARKVREFELLSAIGMRSKRFLSEPLIKLLAALGPFFVLGWIYLAASMNAPLPR